MTIKRLSGTWNQVQKKQFGISVLQIRPLMKSSLLAYFIFFVIFFSTQYNNCTANESIDAWEKLQYSNEVFAEVVFSGSEVEFESGIESAYYLAEKASSTNQISLGFERYLASLSGREPLTLSHMINIGHAVLALLLEQNLFSTTMSLYCHEGTFEGEVFPLTKSVFFNKDFLLARISKVEPQLRFCAWYKKNVQLSNELITKFDYKDGTKIYRYADRLQREVGREIAYHWKAAIIRWIEIDTKVYSNIRRLKNMLPRYLANHGTSLQAYSNLTKLLNAANEWSSNIDIITRSNLFDGPISLHINIAQWYGWAGWGLFDDDEDELISAGRQLGKMYPFQKYIVLKSTEDFYYRVLKGYKKRLSKAEYGEIITRSKHLPDWFKKRKPLNEYESR